METIVVTIQPKGQGLIPILNIDWRILILKHPPVLKEHCELAIKA
jgi:hypothetical protein